jgi:hypothetical protein
VNSKKSSGVLKDRFNGKRNGLIHQTESILHFSKCGLFRRLIQKKGILTSFFLRQYMHLEPDEVKNNASFYLRGRQEFVAVCYFKAQFICNLKSP